MSNNLIPYRGVYPDRLDAPFVGSLIFAADCHHNCPGCCHEDRHTKDLLSDTVEDIISKVLSNPFNEGIILGGFEWTEQYEDLLSILDYATSVGLKLMLYTHYDKVELMDLYPELYTYSGMYIKYGEYRRDLSDPSYTSYGIPLASTNQYIEIVP